MGKMLISAWLAVASGKLGGRSLTGDANDDVFKNLVNGEDIPDDLLKVIPTSPDLNPDDEPLTAELEWDKLDDLLSKTPTADPLAASNPNPNEPAQSIGGNDESSSTQAPAKVVEQVNVEPLGDGNGGDGLETGSGLEQVQSDLEVPQTTDSTEGSEQKTSTTDEATTIPPEVVEVPSLAASISAASPASLNTEASLLAFVNTYIENEAGGALRKGLEGLGVEKVEKFFQEQLNLIKGKFPDWENARPEDIQEAVEKELLGGHSVEDLLDPSKWTSIVTSVTAYDEEDTLVQYLADPESKYIKYVWYGYLLHAGLWSGDVILTLLGGILPKPVKWLFSLFFGSSTIGFLATNVIAVWQGASTKYYILAAAHLAVIIVKILTNIIAIGPLKLIRWILNPALELLGAVNIFFVSLLPIYHAYNTAPKTVKTVLSSFSGDVKTAADAFISKVTS